ncbi:MAG: 4-hydroxy-tetrahydrodipicolinate synthase [Gammaproteobacteria bacterium]
MIKGSIVALVTPMHASGEIDWVALEALVEWHIELGTAALVVVGTTGESATLGFDEHKRVVSQCVAWARGRIVIIAGTGANCTREALELTESALASKADACLLVTPYYNKPTQEGLYQHYATIAKHVPIPQILYNVPGRTCCDLSVETTLRLAKIANIIGLKDATGDLERVRPIVEQAGDDFRLYSGEDATAAELILRGGHGSISVTANVVPDQSVAMCQKALAGDEAGARALNDHLMPLHRALFVESNPIPVKWALYEMGRISDGIRLPLTPLSEAARPGLREVLEEVGCALPQVAHV